MFGRLERPYNMCSCAHALYPQKTTDTNLRCFSAVFVPCGKRRTRAGACGLPRDSQRNPPFFRAILRVFTGQLFHAGREVAEISGTVPASWFGRNSAIGGARTANGRCCRTCAGTIKLAILLSYRRKPGTRFISIHGTGMTRYSDFFLSRIPAVYRADVPYPKHTTHARDYWIFHGRVRRLAVCIFAAGPVWLRQRA